MVLLHAKVANDEVASYYKPPHDVRDSVVASSRRRVDPGETAIRALPAQRAKQKWNGGGRTSSSARQYVYPSHRPPVRGSDSRRIGTANRVRERRSNDETAASVGRTGRHLTGRRGTRCFFYSTYSTLIDEKIVSVTATWETCTT